MNCFAIGLAAGTMLLGVRCRCTSDASIKLKVTVDEKVQQVHEALPNHCRACGFAGCFVHKAVVENRSFWASACPRAGGGETIAGFYLQVNGRPAASAGVHCRAPRATRRITRLYGLPLCTAANALNVRPAFGCLGFGDCTRACKFDALHIIDGLATVDYEKCTGCTACSKVCPRNLIEMVPFGQENMMTVACSSRESGKVTRSMCQVGCIACGLCAKQSDLFKVEDNLARMDYGRYAPSEATETAMTKCPTGVIVERGKTARQPRAAGEKAAKASAYAASTLPSSQAGGQFYFRQVNSLTGLSKSALLFSVRTGAGARRIASTQPAATCV